MASYTEVAAYIGKDTKDRAEAKKFIETFAAENEITTSEIFNLYAEAEGGARRERELEGYFDY